MICLQCNNQNPVEAKFCMDCGSALATICDNCGEQLPAEARFCMSCGQAVGDIQTISTPTQIPPSLARTGERRVVTVMFADISDFTRLSEKMDPEQVRNLINNCFDRLVPVIEKYEGTVDKFIGDEIMVLFGAPVAHEDDAVRALHTALELRDTLAQFNKEQDIELEIHVGINTGLVVAGGIGSQGRRAYSVMGDAVNVASRLEAISERGEILVGSDTYNQTEPFFDYLVLKPIKVKGRREPVGIYKLEGSKKVAEQSRGLVGFESQLVGRDKELAALLRISEAVVAGVGRTAVIYGEPGMGKSRLVSEWQVASGQFDVVNAEHSRLKWVYGQCLSYGQGLAYHLVIDILRSLIGVTASASESERRAALRLYVAGYFGEEADDIYPYLGNLLSLDLEPEAMAKVNDLDPQALQSLYLAAIRRLLARVANERPLILIIEDIHWADSSSSDVLIKLLSLINDAAITFCFTMRSERDSAGWRLEAAVRKQLGESLTEFTLHQLSEENSQQLIPNMLDIETLPADIMALILQRAEGNPFFVEEVIRMLIGTKALVQENGRWAVHKEIESIEIPDNIQGLLMARIDRLPENVKNTLRVAAVIGRQFSATLLLEVLKSVPK